MKSHRTPILAALACILSAGCANQFAPTHSQPAPSAPPPVVGAALDQPASAGSLPPATVARMRAHGVTVSRHDGARTVVISGSAPTVERLPNGLYRVTFDPPDAFAASSPH